MEQQMKQSDSHLKSILNSPVKSVQAVPATDWFVPPPPPVVTSAPPSQTTTTAPPVIQKSASVISVVTPGSTANDPHTQITLQNCVATVDLKSELDLTKINSRTRNSEYNPARFSGLIMRIREPRTTALVFRSGKIVCTGARNENDALLASKKFARIIEKIGFKIRFSDFKLQNIVATCDLRFPIKLENLNQMHGQFSSYEPELFPGLVYRMIKPRLVLLIFVNGKIVFTGGKSRFVENFEGMPVFEKCDIQRY